MEPTTATYEYCRIHPAVWVRVYIRGEQSSGASERECPKCVSERTKKRLTGHLALALLFLAATLSAQPWPQPPKQQGVTVTCAAPSSCAGRPIAAYTSPLLYTGRFLDSQDQREWQDPMRTLRARWTRIVPERDRIYQMQGSLLAMYRLSTFIGRVSANEPLQTVGRAGRVLRWDGNFNVLTAPQCLPFPSPGCWVLENADGQDRLSDFDADDRGFVYIASSQFGWGALHDNGFALTSIYQNHPPDIGANRIMSVRAGSSYYLLVAPPIGDSLLYDVTANPAAPVRHSSRPSVAMWAKSASRIATVERGLLRIYTPAGFIAGQALGTYPPISGSFNSVSIDDATGTVYAGSWASGSPFRVTVVSGTGRQDIQLGLNYANSPTVRYGFGYLAIFGQEQFGANLRLYRVTGALAAELIPIPLLTPSGQQFFAAYHKPVAQCIPGLNSFGYAGPCATQTDGGEAKGDVAFIQQGGRTTMVVSAGALGEVWEIALGGAQTQPAPVPVPVPSPTPQPVCPPCPSQPVPVPVPVPPPVPTPVPVPQPAPAPVSFTVPTGPYVATCPGPTDWAGFRVCDTTEGTDRRRYAKRDSSPTEPEFVAWRRSFRGL